MIADVAQRARAQQRTEAAVFAPAPLPDVDSFEFSLRLCAVRSGREHCRGMGQRLSPLPARLGHFPVLVSGKLQMHRLLGTRRCFSSVTVAHRAAWCVKHAEKTTLEHPSQRRRGGVALGSPCEWATAKPVDSSDYDALRSRWMNASGQSGFLQWHHLKPSGSTRTGHGTGSGQAIFTVASSSAARISCSMRATRSSLSASSARAGGRPARSSSNRDHRRGLQGVACCAGACTGTEAELCTTVPES